MLKNKRTWDMIGAILGIIIIIVGIVFVSTSPDAYTTQSADYASFGADYYTYQYDATRITASNAAVAANNVRELGRALNDGFGMLFIAIGALTTLSYGKKFFTENIVEKAPVAAEEQPVDAPVENTEEV